MKRQLSVPLAVVACFSVGCGSGAGGAPAGGAGGASAGGAVGTGGSTGGAGAGAAGGSSSPTGAGGAGGLTGTGGAGGLTGTGGAGGVTGTGGAGGTTGTGGAFFDFADGTAGMTIAIDAGGTTHAALAALGQQGYEVVYARCASQCDTAQSWTFVPFGLESDTSHVPTVAVTADGRPRILYASELGSAPGFHYLECNSGCEQPAGWSDVRLTTGDPGVNPVPRPSLPFAVSPGGAAAFLYDDGGNAMYAWFCAANCAAGTSWTRLTLGDVYVYPESVAFASDQSLQVVARHGIQDDESLLWLDCSGDCSSLASWAQVDGLVTVHGQLRAAVARTAQGGTRIVFYGDDPGTPAVENVFGYLVCDSGCRTPASWQPPLLLPIPAGAGDVGFGLDLDGAGRPALVFLDDTASGLARCTGNCAGASGIWQLAAGPDVAYLNGAFAPLVPSGCTSASWGMYVGPSLALDAAGGAAMAITAQAKAFGGQCGTGSAAFATSSFVSLP